MKYGEQFENESVPQWSLHNIDYNSLKHHIKAHTTKDQASAIAIPGQPDTALAKFEDQLYAELRRQHDRVDLFVKSKADELARRMQDSSNKIHRQILRLVASRRGSMSLRRRQVFAKYESQLLRCGEEIQQLERFVNAQVVAFRKILKKYKKWTGSSTLGTRFRETVLSDPKSFTRRDNSQLQSHYEDLLETLRATSSTDDSGFVSPRTAPEPAPLQPTAGPSSPSETLVAQHQAPPMGYWNEYDHGSDAGDADHVEDGSYAIYIDPDEEASFLGMGALMMWFKRPVSRWRSAWASGSQTSDTTDSERGTLLPEHSQPSGYGATDTSYFNPIPGVPWRIEESDADDEDGDGRMMPSGRRSSQGYASSTEGFPLGYKAHYAALPSIANQRITHYRDRVLFWGTWAGYLVSFALMGIASILIATGRNKKRLEVDVGVTLGIMASLSSACAALSMACSREGRTSRLYRLAVWSTFATTCVLNGMLLVLIVGNAPLL